MNPTEEIPVNAVSKIILNHLNCPSDEVEYINAMHTSARKTKNEKLLYSCDANGEINIIDKPFNIIEIDGTRYIRHIQSNIFGGYTTFYWGRKDDLKKIKSRGVNKVKNEVKNIHISKEYSSVLANFIERGLENKYNIPLNRGIVLTGKPGNGKSRILQWVYNNYSSVLYNDATIKQYKGPLTTGTKDQKYYIELYDDIDMSIFEEKHPMYNSLLSLFDCCYEGNVIRIFATNQEVSNMSKAFLRPGRINEVLEIQCPTEEERKPLFNDFPMDLTKETEGMSYAEIQFLKVCLINTEFDKDLAFDYLRNKTNSQKQKLKLGFSK